MESCPYIETMLFAEQAGVFSEFSGQLPGQQLWLQWLHTVLQCGNGGIRSQGPLARGGLKGIGVAQCLARCMITVFSRLSESFSAAMFDGVMVCQACSGSSSSMTGRPQSFVADAARPGSP